MEEYEKPTYVSIYKLTENGKKLAKKGTPLENMIENEHYKLFTVMPYGNVRNLEHKLAEIVYRKK